MSSSRSRKSRSAVPRSFSETLHEGGYQKGTTYFAVRCITHTSNPLHSGLEGEVTEGGERILSLPGQWQSVYCDPRHDRNEIDRGY